MDKLKSYDQNLLRKEALVAENLTKNYGSLLALDNISFNVLKGEIFGYLGPNGAGKTTTINIFTGITRASSGIAKIFDCDIRKNPLEAKNLIGIVPQEPFLYNEMSALDNLIFKAKMHNLGKDKRRDKALRLLEEFKLYNRRNDKVVTYSGGMKKLLIMALALIHDPKLLFLDEPTVGLDVRNSRQIRDKIRELNNAGVTIFLTTHNMEEASQLCKRVAIINKGRIISIGSPKRLIQPLQKELLIELELNVVSKKQKDVIDDIEKLNKIKDIKIRSNGLKILIKDQSVLHELFHIIQKNKIKISSMNTKKPTLEEAFIKITE